MKAILEFNLDENDDDMALRRCHKSLSMALVLWELVHNTKKSILYKLMEKKCSDSEIVDMVFDRIHELLEQYNINLDELTE